MDCDFVDRREANESAHRHRWWVECHHRTDLEGCWSASLIPSRSKSESPSPLYSLSVGKICWHTWVQDTKTEGGDVCCEGVVQIHFLGHPAIERLYLIQCIAAAGNELTPKEEFPSLLQGFRKMNSKYICIPFSSRMMPGNLLYLLPVEWPSPYSSQSNKICSIWRTWEWLLKAIIWHVVES